MYPVPHIPLKWTCKSFPLPRHIFFAAAKRLFRDPWVLLVLKLCTRTLRPSFRVQQSPQAAKLQWRTAQSSHIFTSGTIASLGRDPIANEVITKIDHYKKKGPIGHESIVLTVSSKSDSGEVRILLERVPGRRVPILGVPWGHSSSDLARQISEQPSQRKYYHISSVPLRGNDEVLVGDVIGICAQIRKNAPEYHLLSTNCFWFCTKVLEALKDRLNVDLSKEDDYCRGGKWGGRFNYPRSSRRGYK